LPSVASGVLVLWSARVRKWLVAARCDLFRHRRAHPPDARKTMTPAPIQARRAWFAALRTSYFVLRLLSGDELLLHGELLNSSDSVEARDDGPIRS
jgi:hypothetical protein